MSELTHKKARRLAQSAIDHALRKDEKVVLESHLEKCIECRSYQTSLLNIETKLRNILHKQWDSQQPTLDTNTIKEQVSTKFVWKTLFSPTHAFGKVAIVSTLLLSYLLITTLAGNHASTQNPNTPSILPTPNVSSFAPFNSPTPSPAPTITKHISDDCNHLIYIVTTADTIESLALRFEVSKEFIIEQNNLEIDKLIPGKELSIIICNKSSPDISRTPGNTLTITPLIETVLPTKLE